MLTLAQKSEIQFALGVNGPSTSGTPTPPSGARPAGRGCSTPRPSSLGVNLRSEAWMNPDRALLLEPDSAVAPRPAPTDQHVRRTTRPRRTSTLATEPDQPPTARWIWSDTDDPRPANRFSTWFRRVVHRTTSPAAAAVRRRQHRTAVGQRPDPAPQGVPVRRTAGAGRGGRGRSAPAPWGQRGGGAAPQLGRHRHLPAVGERARRAVAGQHLAADRHRMALADRRGVRVDRAVPRRPRPHPADPVPDRLGRPAGPDRGAPGGLRRRAVVHRAGRAGRTRGPTTSSAWRPPGSGRPTSPRVAWWRPGRPGTGGGRAG